jgi:hypothetical protein
MRVAKLRSGSNMTVTTILDEDSAYFDEGTEVN